MRPEAKSAKASGKGQGKGVRRSGTVSYVTGDRQKEGVFPLWSTLLNMTVARQMGRRPWSLVSEREERGWAVPWTKRFTFTEAALEKQITDLSGGNQQKALFTRALLTDTETLLLDDPTRGVDVGVKAEFYQTLRFHVWTYLASGLFGLAAGFCLTGVNTASDVNAAVSYTLLSIAAVVMGGCDLVGGRIDPIGVVLASVTLALLGALLGFLQVSSDFIAAVQGLILLGIVVLRTMFWRRS
jgi:hypothetical protein